MTGATVLEPGLLVGQRPMDLDEWAVKIRNSFMPMDVRSADPSLLDREFRARMGGVSIGDLRISCIDADPHSAHSLEPSRGGVPPFYKFTLQLNGTSMIIQDGRETVLQPGDMAIYDAARPCSLIFTESFSCLLVQLPRHAVELGPAAVRELTARTLCSDYGPAALAKPFLANLAGQIGNCHPSALAPMSEAAVRLIGSVLIEEHSRLGACTEPTAGLVGRVMRYLDGHIADDTLDAKTLAAVHNVSLRSLQRAFTKEGLTVSAAVRLRRLEHARRALLDPANAYQTVAGLAARSGFTDPALFSRLFRQQYGTTPSDYRAGKRPA
ncbi:AraC-like ligand-binding domain-containing protein [Arthrobacter mobilis]|uniref:Helix-turn-helix domain-containing protein n=1 Tax=Arthrobacter mobilis TaxID=2724944 RepID=A0A7X6HDM5_9MICC|nr:helix-turn-helix domain-containing protein [Arthrobacter mobilis]NKX54243.1 helix-turn-helix domain-containing protein [Arthrobacter mobilis]